MRKITLAFLMVLTLVFASSSLAYAYTTTFSDILTDDPGTARLTVDIWDPSDNHADNYYKGTGYWGYIYTIENIDYDDYLTDFAIGTAANTPIILVTTPSGWGYKKYTETFGWDALTAADELDTGHSVTGFEIKSTWWPTYVNATAWRAEYDPAYGITKGPATPEPASMVLLGMGLLGFCGIVRKRVKA